MLSAMVLIALGFVLLIYGADWLIRGAASLARTLGVSDFVIGLTVVAFGTSAPELFVNVLAAIQGRAGITVGNIVGSNIFNLGAVLGVAGLIYPLAVSRGTVWKEIPMSLLSAMLTAALVWTLFLPGSEGAILHRWQGMVLLAGFAAFLWYSMRIAGQVAAMDEELPEGEHGRLWSILAIAGGLTGLVLGSQWVVQGAVRLAGLLGLGETIVGLTIVAAGTSLPELVTSAVAAWKKNADIAVGNVVGSNIFNVLMILGLSAVIRPVPFEVGVRADLIAMIVLSVALFVFMFTGKARKLDRWEAALFLLGYIGYTAWRVLQARS